MVSHQPTQPIINFNQVSDSSAVQECLQEMCPNLLMRSETAYSERQEPEASDVQIALESSISQDPREISIIKTAQRSGPQDIYSSSTPMTNLFVGSMYWEKVASNRVYPREVFVSERELMILGFRQKEEQKSDQDWSESIEDFEELQLQYCSESEWYDCDVSEIEKCLSQ